MKMADQRKGLLLLASCVLFACLIAGGADNVPDGVVYTDLLKTVQKGNSVILKCKFYRAPIAVYWKKADDPDHGTTLITWVEGTKHSVACANGNKCDINDEFSLTIEDVQIADQGRYICRVSNYLGILIYNYTDVQVYAPPVEPFPVITGCEGTNSGVLNSTEHCTVFASAPVTITCSALNYYPDLDIFFLHGSKRISDIDTDERENIDGTKNKSIFINGSPSKNPYVCVASDVPGSQDQFTATVLVSLPAVPTSENGVLFTSEGTEKTTVTKKSAIDNKSAKIAIPMVLIVVVAAVVASAFVWRARKGKGILCYKGRQKEDVERGLLLAEALAYELWLLAYDTPEGDMGKVRETLLKLDLECGSKGIMAPKEIYEALCKWKDENDVDQARLLKEALEDAQFEGKWQQIHGIVSFYELWILIYGTKDIDLKKVRIMLREMGLKDVPEYLSKKVAYEMLCKWKEEDKNCVQTKRLKDALSKADMEQNWKIMIDTLGENQKKCSGISRALLRQVIADVEHADKINELLRKLVPDRFEDLHTTQNREAVAWDPMHILLEWSKRPFEENPNGLLSLALEKAGCSPTDRTFFAGIVSFYELWLLIYGTKKIDLERIRIILNELGLEDVPEDLSERRAYETLCKWKEENSSCAQKKLLKDAFDKAKFEQSWKVMTEQYMKKDAAVVDNALEQLVQGIGNLEKIDNVICTLDPDRNTRSPGDRNAANALAELKKWSKGQLEEDPLVLISLVVEWTRCSPLDRTFFTGKKLSFYELWSLSYGNNGDNVALLKGFLGLTDDKVTKEATYEALWKWKDVHKYEDQMQILKDAVSRTERGDISHILSILHELSVDTHTKIPDHTVEKIIEEVGECGKTEQFLQELSPNRDHSNTDAKAMLEEWSRGPFRESPVVLLSRALENAGCDPVDRSFFTVPPHMQKPIASQEVKDCVRKLAGRHSTRLANELAITDLKKISLISDENDDAMFDTTSVIRDWIVHTKCSHYDKRCRLDDALIKIGRHDMRNCFGTADFLRPLGNLPEEKHPYSDEFEHGSAFADDMVHMVRYLPKELRTSFCKELGLTFKEGLKEEHCLDEVHPEGTDIAMTENMKHVTLADCVKLFDSLLETKRYKALDVTDEELETVVANVDSKILREILKQNTQPAQQERRSSRFLWTKRRQSRDTPGGSGESFNISDINEGNEEKPTDHGETPQLSTIHDDNESQNHSPSDLHDYNSDDVQQQSANGITETTQQVEKNEEMVENVDLEKRNTGPSVNQKVVSNERNQKNGHVDHEEPDIGENRSDSEIQRANESTISTANGTPKVVLNLPTNGKDNAESSLVLLKEWRQSQDGETCHGKFRELLAFIGLKECVVDVLPAKYIYDAELFDASFSMLMRDVLPFIVALGMDLSKVLKYRKYVSAREKKGSVGLLLQLKHKMKRSDNRRLAFCLALIHIGYPGVARSVYFDYKPSLSELYNALCSLWETEKSQLAEYLQLSKKDIAKCTDYAGQINHLYVMRQWRNRPTPCHYRVELAAGLRKTGRNDVADKVLSGHYRQMEVNVDVLRDICNRLTDDETSKLRKVLELKPGKQNKEESNTTMVIHLVCKWLKEATLEKLKNRRDVNNELIQAGFYGLAEEIMILERAMFSRK